MIDQKTLMAFFDFDKPCPSVIKDCSELRGIYKKQKDKIVSKQCTTCTVADYTNHFIKNVLYKQYFNIEKLSSINDKKKPIDSKDMTNEIFTPKKLFYEGKPISETTYFGKNYLYIVSDENNYKVFGKILFSFTIFDIKFMLLGRFENSLRKFKILIFNEKTYKVLYVSKERKSEI